MDHRTLLYFGIIAGFALLELASRRFTSPQASRRETLLDLSFFLSSTAVIGPLVALALSVIERKLFPEYAGRLSGTPVWLQFIAFLVFEDMVQYWYHRSVHQFKVLWPLHLPHHTAPYMGTRMVYRNGFFYTLLFPNVWLGSALVYLGFGEVFFVYSTIKALVTIGAHSTIRWDQWLYRYRPLRPLAWIIERTLSTPATHFAHHAAAEGDGIGHHSGNFGNLLFFWDVLYGTALISRQYPPAFGLDQRSPDFNRPWAELMFYPLVRRKPATESAPASTLAPAPLQQG